MPKKLPTLRDAVLRILTHNNGEDVSDQYYDTKGNEVECTCVAVFKEDFDVLRKAYRREVIRGKKP